MIYRLVLLAAVLTAAGFAPAPFPKPQRGEPKKSLLDRMQGWWEIVGERQGGRAGRGPASRLRLSVKGDRLQYFIGDSGADAWTITVDEGQRPPTLDKMSPGSAKGSKATYLGRVSVEGDVLKVTWQSASARPADLSGDQATAITFRRERK